MRSLDFEMLAAKRNKGGGDETSLDGYEGNELGANLLDGFDFESHIRGGKEISLTPSANLEPITQAAQVIKEYSRKAAGYFHNVSDDVITKICGEFLMVKEFVRFTSTSKAFDKLRWSDNAWKVFDDKKKLELDEKQQELDEDDWELDEYDWDENDNPRLLMQLALDEKNLSNVNLLAKWVKNTHYIEWLVLKIDFHRDLYLRT
jgi:hypothetical protein